jgi:hypothetical protein
MDKDLKLLRVVFKNAGDLKKIDQIISSNLLNTKGGCAEIHFDADGNIRKIVVPQISIFPQKELTV